MLRNLCIENIAVAKNIDVDFNEGFTVITGQTGAGKSIIIDSLLLLCGAKNGRELIRTGESRAVVTGLFYCTDSTKANLFELGYSADENNEITLSRIVNADGRSSAKINGRTVPVSVLKEVSPMLLGIQTQSEKSTLTEKANYTALLDSFSCDSEELAEYDVEWEKLLSINGRITELRKAISEREMMLDILKYQKKEIDSAHFSADDEEEKLLRLRTKLKSSEKFTKYASVVTKALAFSEKGTTAAYLLEKAENALEQISDAVEDADEMAQKLANYRYEIIDIAERVKNSIDDDMVNPAERLTQVESRLSLIERLEKKYGSNISEIKSKRAEIAAKIKELEEGDEKLQELEDEKNCIREKATALANKISVKRTEAAKKVSDEIVSYLRFLDMPKVRFRISVTPVRESSGEYALNPNGYDDVDFLISVNTGEELASLGKVSSGGEMSRITLAIKTALAGNNDSGTLVFDEIDAGVSGGTAEKIGIMLDKLSSDAQVISVTHSPQIASIAANHLLIEKRENNGRTESAVSEIRGDERVGEIARIIGGISVTEKQIAAAREMLSKNKNIN